MLDPKYNPEHWEDARFLGRGTCTTSQIFFTSPSRCAVADSCSISIDRRMTAGETYQSCLKEIEDLPACKKYAKDIKVSMYMYDRPSWTGHVYETECFLPHLDQQGDRAPRAGARRRAPRSLGHRAHRRGRKSHVHAHWAVP